MVFWGSEEQVDSTVSQAIGAATARQVPSAALALYARWWQLETWLRQLAYVELRSAFGARWVDELDPAVKGRQKRDAREYMASPDWKDPLAYSDASVLGKLIDSHWDLFKEALLGERETWASRFAELLTIRHRISHLRRPHADDLTRLELTMRDLEPGTCRSVAAYGACHPVDPNADDPVVDGWVRGTHADARRLIKHAERQYQTALTLSTTVRPWATRPDRNECVSGKPGIYWNVEFFVAERPIDIKEFWNAGELQRHARPLLAHVLHNYEHSLSVTFPAIEDGERIADAIGNVFDAVLGSLRHYRPRSDVVDDRLSRLGHMDPRVQIRTPWSLAGEGGPILDIFGA